MSARKQKLEVQKLVKDLAGLVKKYQLRIDSKRFISVYDLQMEAGAVLARAFRLGLFDSDGRLSRIIGSFQPTVVSRTNYQMIYQAVCEKYPVDHRSGFDFDLKRHQHGAEKALIESLRWFEAYLSKIAESTDD